MHEELEAALKFHPRKNDKVFRYGTAGFRDLGAELDFIMFRMGLLAVMRSIEKEGQAIGVMVTASHNPEQDNGVKLVDPFGEMLEASWEGIATELVAASDEDLVQVLSKIGPLDKASIANVILGQDTRRSSEALAGAIADGVQCLGANLRTLGLVTTPQLHFVVACTNNKSYGAPSVDGYCAKLCAAFDKIHQGVTDVQKYSNKVVFDGANGVGVFAMKRFLKALGGDILNVEFFLPERGRLNENCGSDFVKTEQRLPLGMDVEPGTRCVSFDGDADRIVYYYNDSAKVFRLLDGDKISALVAGFLSDLLKKCGISAKLGVVQTAYANGSSTKYLEEVMGVPVACAKTGVKHLHKVAVELFDIGVYFEANGHGTVVFKESVKQEIRTKAGSDQNAQKLLAFVDLINETVGDALSIFLLVEAILMTRGWNMDDWNNSYSDLPNKMLKVLVKDRYSMETTDAERRCVKPVGIQEKIDEVVGKFVDGRSFVRPSGTEDVVRVYAEAATKPEADALAEQVADIVRTFCG